MINPRTAVLALALANAACACGAKDSSTATQGSQAEPTAGTRAAGARDAGASAGRAAPWVDAATPDAALAADAARIDSGIEQPGCDPITQRGCQAGEKCDLSGAAPACVHDGTLVELQRCEANIPNGCEAGSTCVETAYGDHRCARFCDPRASRACMHTGQDCNATREIDGYRFTTCDLQHECSPLRQDCAAPNATCYWTVAGAFCLAPAKGPRLIGAACHTPQECARGSTCWSERNSDDTRCTATCDPSASTPACPEGLACVPAGEIGGDSFGLCLTPGSG